jgi:hypothetical protein
MAIVMKLKLTIPLVRNKKHSSFVPLMIAQESIVLVTFSAEIGLTYYELTIIGWGVLQEK